MIWRDFALEGSFSVAEIEHALPEVLGLPAEAVRVVSSVEDCPDTGVCVVVQEINGDYAVLLAVFVGEGIAMPDSIDVLRRMSIRLKSSVLTSDDSTDPYVMLWGGRDGRIRRVALDVDALDEQGIYRIHHWLS
jgi:hypothetical protein